MKINFTTKKWLTHKAGRRRSIHPANVVLLLLMLLSFSAKLYATDCPGATTVPGAPSMPYVITLACGTTNDITSTNSTTCGSGSYKGGWEAVYVWTPSGNYIDVSFAYTGQTWTGIFLYEGCPTTGGICIGNYTGSGSSKTLAYTGTNMTSGTKISVNAGTTYYIVVDTYPSPDSPCPGTLTINGTLAVACSGTPAPGNTISTANPACTGVNFTLSLQNVTPGTGVTYQWESSPDNITWTPIASAIASTYVANQTTATWYRCQVTCAGNTGTSTPLQVTMDVPANCYCACIAANIADEEIYSVTVNGATNAYDCLTVAPGPGSILLRYSNFTTLGPLTSIQQGATVPFSVLQDECDGATYYGNGLGIWIDYNQDGDFTDPGEEVFKETVSTVGPRTITGSFVVPVTALTGNTRMRIIDAEGYYGATLTPCLAYNYGETEDYIVTIAAASTPALAPTPGGLHFGYIASGSVSTEQSYALSGLNLTGAPGNIVVTAPAGFEVSLTSGSGFAGTINVPYTSASLSATVYVRFAPTGPPADYIDNITNVGGGANCNVAVTGTSILTYCTSNLGGNGACPGDITDVTINTLVNPAPHTNCTVANGSTYGSYPAVAPTTTGLNRGSQYSLSVSTSSSDIVSVWIDFNANGMFETTEWWQVYTTGTTGSVSITVPMTASLGTTGMRIRSRLTGNQNDAGSACLNFGSGMCEDYTITILPPASCPAPSGVTAGSITQSSASIDWTENGTATSWQYEYGINGFTPGTGTMAVTGTKPVTLTPLNPSTIYQIRVRSICAPGDTSGWSALTSFTTLCAPYSLPFSENFDATAINALPPCWSYTNDNADAYYWFVNSYSPHSSPNCAYVRYNSSLAMNDWLYTPQLHLVGNKYYKVDFWYSNDGGGTWQEKMEVKWGTVNTAAGMTEGPIFDDNNILNGWKQGSGIIHPTTTGDYFVGFHGYSDADEDVLLVDDVLISEIPFADIAVIQTNVENCDTLGWFAPPITIQNVGDDTVKVGDTIKCTYVLDGGTPVNEDFIVTSEILPGASETFSFTTLIHFNQFITHNAVFTALWYKDMNLANNTVNFTVTMKPLPVVNLGPNQTICNNQSIVLDAGNSGASYLWFDAAINQTHPINVSFCSPNSTCIYWVDVTVNGCTTRDSVSVTFDPCTGIEAYDNGNLSVYPNPTTGIILVEMNGLTGNIDIRVMNLHGQVVYQESVSSVTYLFSRQLDLSVLPKGVYMLNLRNASNSLYHKIVIE